MGLCPFSFLLVLFSFPWLFIFLSYFKRSLLESLNRDPLAFLFCHWRLGNNNNSSRAEMMRQHRAIVRGSGGGVCVGRLILGYCR